MKTEAEKPKRRETSGAVRRAPHRWKVVARVHPQGDAGVRWVQLTYAREEEPEDWPYSRQGS